MAAFDCSQPWIGAGPMNIDYVHLYYCSFESMGPLAALLLLLWVTFLATLLGNTAQNYFSPTLASICTKLKTPYDIAGVTFLAFGNGSPDIFSSLSSFSGNTSVLVGIGAMLGGSMFITTIVVGTISIMSPCKVSGYNFFQNIIFHLTAVTAVTFLAIQERINIAYPFMLLSVYCVYVFFVLTSSWLKFKLRSILGAEDGASEDIAMTDVGRKKQIQTAFWLDSGVKEAAESGGRRGLGMTSSAFREGEGSGGSGYKFLILDEEEGEANDGSDGEGDEVINLSGGLMFPSFSGAIIEDYYDGSPADNGVTIDSSSPPSGNLNEALLPPPRPTRKKNQRRTGGLGLWYETTILNSLYWQQMAISRRIQRSFLSHDWWQYPIHYKVLALLELPFTLARDLTIPTVDLEMWSKVHAVLQPQFAALFLAYVSGKFYSRVGSFPVPALAVLVGAIPAILVFLFTYNNKPPGSKAFITIWMAFAFVMCIAWIFIFAKELVTSLTAIGAIFAISPAYLGLTVLAWGNSMGDFFSNISLAQQGLGEMGIAGCYGGPVFNILIGLSISLFYATIVSYPATVDIKFDTSSIVSLVFIYISLLSTLFIVYLKDFNFDKTLGYYLYGLYVAYTVVQFAVLMLDEDR